VIPSALHIKKRRCILGSTRPSQDQKNEMPTKFCEVVYSPITSISEEHGVAFQFLGHCRRLSAEAVITDTLPETAMLMMWLVEGEMDVQVEDGVHSYSAGDALLLSPHSRYDVSIQNTPVTYWWGVMHGPALPGMLEESGLETGTIYGLAPPEYQIRLLMEDMRADTLTENMQRHQAQMVAQFLEVAAEHVRTHGTDPILARATATIERNLGDRDLSVQRIAKLVGVHRTSLSRLFREAYGQTASNYILEKRLQSACQQLRGTTRKVSEVAGLCGFENLSSFSRSFRRHVGLSPTAYRESGCNQGNRGQDCDCPC
jgi:AraC-like DNA-binding protein